MAKDLLPFMRSDAEAFSMDKVLRQAVVVPESKRVDRMLKEFRSQRYQWRSSLTTPVGFPVW